MRSIWQIQLLGGLCARHRERVVERFQTRQTGGLLAYLAFYRERAHAREFLGELLWPGDEPEVARRKLRVALHSLRRQLEPPGVRGGEVIAATRTTLQLRPEAVTTDVAALERGVAAARGSGSDLERAERLEAAVGLYDGELLPGCGDEWVMPERQRLEAGYLTALGELIRLLEEAGEVARAVRWARRAVEVDPLREEAHHELMRLLVAAGQPEAALHQYQQLERLLEAELGTVPEASTRRLAAGLQRSLQDGGAASAAKPGAPPTVAGALPAEGAPGRAAAERSDLSGIVTLLMVEIEGSPAQGGRAGAPFPAVMEACDRLIGEAAGRHSGREVRRSGDSWRVAFQRPADAVAAAVAAQRALASHPWPEGAGLVRARVALHTGEMEGGVKGPLLHHLTRLTLAAHGGQILLCEATAALLREQTEPEFTVVDLGRFRLRSGAPPERIFQLDSPEMPPGPLPPPNAAPAYEGHLPLRLTRFFGREAELARLRELLESEKRRLVTLTGPGGSGKTRLAVEVADQLSEPLRGAVWFVPLADLAEASRIPEAIRDALRLPREGQREPLEQVVEALAPQPSLLVLDNFEHLVAAGAAVVWTLLARVPELSCLVTSRRALDLLGEREIDVHPLPVPEAVAGPEQLAAYTSVQLFVDRAQAVRPDFQVTRGNTAAIAELCRRLEGLPLALELAAARSRVLSPAQILAQLNRRFDFLVVRKREATSRHQSLRTTLDWSYRLLTPDQQQFFARLSVFRGGWTADAAEAVCDEPLALEHLHHLRECSLIVTEEDGAGLRFRMLETMREYAAEQLGAEVLAAAQRRHAEYYLALAEQAEPELTRPQQATWLGRLESEHENLRSALDWIEQRGMAEMGLRLSAALWWFWQVKGHWREGRFQLKRVLAMPGAQAPTAVRAKALNRAGAMAAYLGENQEALRLLEESLAIRRELGDRRSLTGPLNSLGNLSGGMGDLPASQRYFEECLAIYQEAGDTWGAAMARGNLAKALRRQGKTHESRPLLEESLEVMRALGDTWHTAWMLANLGHGAVAESDYARAVGCYREALRLFRAAESRAGVGECLEGLAVVAEAEGDPGRAARLLGAARGLADAVDAPPILPSTPEYSSSPAHGLSRRMEQELPVDWAKGYSWNEEQAVAYALQEAVDEE